jgi:hypothetical protein
MATRLGGGNGTGEVPKLGGGSGTGEVPKLSDGRAPDVSMATRFGGGNGTGEVPKLGGGSGTGEVPKLSAGDLTLDTSAAGGSETTSSGTCGSGEHPIETVGNAHPVDSSRAAKAWRKPITASTTSAARDN